MHRSTVNQGMQKRERERDKDEQTPRTFRGAPRCWCTPGTLGSLWVLVHDCSGGNHNKLQVGRRLLSSINIVCVCGSVPSKRAEEQDKEDLRRSFPRASRELSRNLPWDTLPVSLGGSMDGFSWARVENWHAFGPTTPSKRPGGFSYFRVTQKLARSL